MRHEQRVVIVEFHPKQPREGLEKQNAHGDLEAKAAKAKVNTAPNTGTGKKWRRLGRQHR